MKKILNAVRNYYQIIYATGPMGMISEQLLREFCKANGIVATIERLITSSDAAVAAKPHLKDAEAVIRAEMLLPEFEEFLQEELSR